MRISSVVFVAALALIPWRAGADPLPAPSREYASILPTPLADPFYDPPPGFEQQPNGTVLARRDTRLADVVMPSRTTQLLVRSSDVRDRPIAVTTTVVVPDAPWPGPGPRPVVAYNLPINSLGNACAPSYQLPRGTSLEMPFVQHYLDRNYAVVITDHEGPRQAYAAGRLAAHAVLDALRGTLRTADLGLSADAPIAITGYSGGAIASGWAAELAADYAPELHIAGVAIGGVPADYGLLTGSMNGRYLSATLYLAAALGVAREYPELLTLLNDTGWRLAQTAKDFCTAALGAPGLVAPIPAAAASDVPDVTNSPVARQVIAENRLGARAPSMPVYLYQGEQDPWITANNAEHLFGDWCAGGGSVQLHRFVGEHLTGIYLGADAVYGWVDDRLAGRPLDAGCHTG